MPRVTRKHHQKRRQQGLETQSPHPLRQHSALNLQRRVPSAWLAALLLHIQCCKVRPDLDAPLPGVQQPALAHPRLAIPPDFLRCSSVQETACFSVREGEPKRSKPAAIFVRCACSHKGSRKHRRMS